MVKKRILIIEDDEMLDDIYMVNFGKVPEFITNIAKNAKEAEFQLEKNPPDLIILDLLLPGKDDETGLSILRELNRKGLTPGLPVLVATNLENFELINRTLKLGAKDYFVKSDVDVDDLIKQCKMALGIPE